VGDRSVQAGQTIRLRARFKDDLGEVTTASGVFIHIWEPDADTDDFGAAYVVSGVPSSLGEGIYEYEFITPNCGPQGFWHDHWEGILACQDVEAEFLFYVGTAGTASSLDCQLFDNNLVQVTIPSGIKATDGSLLADEFEFEFMTVTNPSYTNLRKVRLETGGFTGDLEDDVIQTAILEASLDADSITASAPPTVSTATKAQDATLTGWTTSVTAGDILGFNVDSITTATRAHLILKCDMA